MPYKNAKQTDRKERKTKGKRTKKEDILKILINTQHINDETERDDRKKEIFGTYRYIDREIYVYFSNVTRRSQNNNNNNKNNNNKRRKNNDNGNRLGR